MGNCEPHLLNHYLKFGSRSYGDLYNHPRNAALVRIVFVTGDLEYLGEIESPMLPYVSRRTKPVVGLDRILACVFDGASVRSEELDDTTEFQGDVASWLTAEEGLRGVLGELNDEESSLLLAQSHLLTCRPGDELIRKGHVSRTLYMLLSGSLEVRDDGELLATVEEPGAVLGEVAFFSDDRRRISDVVAGAAGAQVLALGDHTLRKLVTENGPLAAKFLLFITRGLCAKLRERSSGTPRPLRLAA